VGAAEWAAIIAAAIALVGVVVTAIVTWRANKQLESRWRTELAALEQRTRQAEVDEERRDRRDQAMDAHRWAAELAVSGDPAKEELGVDQLTALLRSNLLDDDLKLLVAAALESAVKEPQAEIEAAQNAEADRPRVLEASLEEIVDADVVSEDDQEEAERA
jgi:hypothetical protein